MTFREMRVSPLVLLAALLLAGCATSNSVVNLSHYDERTPDFARMRDEGVMGVIHEATFPVGNADGRYTERQTAATRAGLLWGAYHYGDGTDPAKQADAFLAFVRGQWRQDSEAGPGVLLVLDFEANTHYGGGTMPAKGAAAFVEEVRRRTGKYPGLYGSENRLRKVLGAADDGSRRSLGKCWLWIANYHQEPGSVEPWSGWQLWQYTGDGVCELRPRSQYPIGVADMRQAERNLFRGSADEVRGFWEAHAWKPEEG